MFDLSLLSKYRGQLMGFSIFIIVFYHFSFGGGGSFVDVILEKCFSQGYIGVDFFMILSGLGLTYSLSKNENLCIYYLKRWVRIFPFFTFITLVECYIIRGESLGLSLVRSTTLGYYLGFPYIDWFVPGIVGLYIIFPVLYFGVIKPRRIKIAFMLCGMIMLLSFIISLFNILDWKHFALLYRIPAFIIGAVIAMCIQSGYDIRKVKITILFSSALGIVIALLSKMLGGSHTLWLFNACMTPFYLLIIIKVFCLLNTNCVGGGGINSFLGFLGLITLELYRVSSSFERLLTEESSPHFHYLYVVFYFFISVFLAWLCHIIFKQINAWIYNRMKSLLERK